MIKIDPLIFLKITRFIKRSFLQIIKLMKKCDLCKKSDKIHYRVKSKIHKDWIFCCKACWDIVSEHNDYSYGGTRKSNDK